MLVLLSVPILGKKPSFRALVDLLLGFLGALVVATKGNLADLDFTDPLGVLFGFGSAIIWALYWILNLHDERLLVENMFWNFLFGFAYSSVIVFSQREH